MLEIEKLSTTELLASLVHGGRVKRHFGGCCLLPSLP